jgi:transcriptional regulator of arginine metabolism
MALRAFHNAIGRARRWCYLFFTPTEGVLANKLERQATIREIVESRAVASQEELRKLLLQRGWDVTQSTLSRDLHEMRLARIPTQEGGRYAFPDMGENSEPGTAGLEVLLPALFRKVDAVGELIVLKTVTGSAGPVAVALDAEDHPDVVGTIAGDDTILIICRSRPARERLLRRIARLTH